MGNRSEMEMNFRHLKNPGLGFTVIPQSLYDIFQEEITSIQDEWSDDTCNDMLAGHLEKEYILKTSRPAAATFLETCANQWVGEFKFYKYDLKLKSLWVNFQQKNEYNPLHNHTGSLSFVIWFNIPYKHKDEMNHITCKNSATPDSASSFQFVYNNIAGEIVNETFNCDHDWNGRMIMFPAPLLHQVYPFKTSDGYRISISGNLQ